MFLKKRKTKKIKKIPEKGKIILQFKMEVPEISDLDIANLTDQIKTITCLFFAEKNEQEKNEQYKKIFADQDSSFIALDPSKYTDPNQIFPPREITKDVMFYINPEVLLKCPFCKKEHRERLWFNMKELKEVLLKDVPTLLKKK